MENEVRSRRRFSDDPAVVIQNWMRGRDVIEFLGLWEMLHNFDFKPIEFEGVKNQAGANAFTMSPKKWIENINTIGIDYGWSGMKTVHEVFTSGCEEISTELAFTENLLEFGGKYYKIGSKRLEVKDTKVTDENYYMLTLSERRKQQQPVGREDQAADSIFYRMFHWKFTVEQKEELKQAMAVRVPKDVILSYFYLETSVVRMMEIRRRYE